MADTNTGPQGQQAAAPSDWTTRRAKIRQRLGETGSFAVVSGPGDDMLYLLGGHSIADERPCLLFTTLHGDGLLLPRLAEHELRPLTADVDVQVWDDGEPVLIALRSLMDRLGFPADAKLVVDASIRADALLMLQAARPDATTDTKPHLVADARAVKDGTELARLENAARLADAAVAFAWSVVREGMSERELSSLVRAFHEEKGGESAFAGVSFGCNSALPHHSPGSRTLRPGDAILLDTGSRLDGYTSDITRMAWFGPAPTREFLATVAQVETAVKAGYAAAKPEATGSAVDEATRTSLDEAGVGEYFVHRTGHGIGLSVHEAPYLAPGSPDVLSPGAAFTIEPGIYLPGRFGVRLEDSVVMTPKGPTALTRFPRNLKEIRP